MSRRKNQSLNLFPATIVSPKPEPLRVKQLASRVRPMGQRSDQARQRIREEMERKKLSQREVADLLQWSQSRVGKLLTGRVQMGVDDLDGLCFAVGLSLTEAIRDRGLEFFAEMTPTELRALQNLRMIPADQRDAFVHLLQARAGVRPDRHAGPLKKGMQKK